MDKREESFMMPDLRFVVRDGQRVLQQRRKITRYYFCEDRKSPVVEDGYDWRDVPCVAKE
jgi:hypothetical protein